MLIPSLLRASRQAARETSLQTRYFGKLLFPGSRLPLLDWKLPQGGKHGCDALTSIRCPSWAWSRAGVQTGKVSEVIAP